MKQNKLILAVLVLIAVLFLLGLSSGFFREKDENDNDLSMRKAVELKNSWIGSISEKMDPFRRSLDMDRIKKRPECQVNDGVYKLTGKQGCCRIIITEKAGADVEYAVLSAKEKNIKLLVLYPDNEPCPQTARGSKIPFDKFKHSEVITDIGRIRPGLGQPVVPQKNLFLSVVYVPIGENEEKAKCGAKVNLCEIEDEVNLTVLGNGGILRLQCENCGDDRSVTAVLR
jgi:hypothetical protein